MSLGRFFSMVMMLCIVSKSIQAWAPVQAGGQVVVTFKNIPDIDNYFYFTKTNWQKNNTFLQIVHDDTRSVFELKEGAVPAKIVQHIQGRNAILRVLANHLDYYEYLVRDGDSVLIEYVNKSPEVKILNRSAGKYDFAVDKIIKEKLTGPGYSPIGMYWGASKINAKRILSNKKLLAANTQSTSQQRMRNISLGTDSVKQELYENVSQFIAKELALLDSLRKITQISELEYRFYKDRNDAISKIVGIETGKISYQMLGKVLQASPNGAGSDFPDMYRRELLNSVDDRFFTRNAEFRDLGDGTNKDYRQAFSFIDTSRVFVSGAKDYLLTRELKRIHKFFSHDDFIHYFAKYESSVQDTVLLKQVRESFSLEFDTKRSETKSVVLASRDGKKMTFEDVKAAHKGKIIYVYFWASWCGPCREAMPASLALGKSLKDKGVVFVYLSIDNTAQPWLSASTKENMDGINDNFLVVNHKTSEFFRKYKLSEIPRYMIFDKTGKLVNANAPRVESSEASLLLTQLAAKP